MDGHDQEEGEGGQAGQDGEADRELEAREAPPEGAGEEGAALPVPQGWPGIMDLFETYDALEREQLFGWLAFRSVRHLQRAFSVFRGEYSPSGR